jgi:hypothetical protein
MMLDEDEAVTLARLLEELATRQGPDPLSTAAWQAAALLWRRVASQGHRHGDWSGRTGPMTRREAGNFRDDAGDSRDIHAGDRDQRADERDEQASERARIGHEADEAARAGEQRILGLLPDAEGRDEMRGQAPALSPAGGDAAGQQDQADQEIAALDWASDREVHHAIREELLRARQARLATRQRRHADAEDRRASDLDRRAAQGDRQDSAHDRLSAHADRDQTVIENEEEASSSDND